MPNDVDREREWLYVNDDSLQGCPNEIKHMLSYVTDLRAFWRRQRHDEPFVSPSSQSWMPIPSQDPLAFENDKSQHYVVPASDEPIFHDIVPQILDSSAPERNAMFLISLMFTGVPGCVLRRDPQALHASRSKVQPLQFALSYCPFNEMDHRTRNRLPLFHLILGMKGPANTHHRCRAQERPPTLTSMLDALTWHAKPHLDRLAFLVRTGAPRQPMQPTPTWLVLFGVVCDAGYLRIVAHMPYVKEKGDLGYVSFLLDELPLSIPLSTEGGRPSVVVALMVLRWHASKLSNFLSTSAVPILCKEPCGDRLWPSYATDHSVLSTSHSQTGPKSIHSDSRRNYTSSGSRSSTRYSTCPSSAELPIGSTTRSPRVTDKSLGTPASSGRYRDQQWNGSSATSSFDSSCSSSCSSFSCEPNPSHSEHLRSASGKSERAEYMEPSTSSLSEGKAVEAPLLQNRREARRSEIIAWALQVVPCRPPEDDAYCMMVNPMDHLRSEKK